MGVTKQWLKGQSFARSIKRAIDRNTLLDLMGIVIYEANRATALEDAGVSDDAPAVDCLYDYVLDAIGIPPESATFSRAPFESLFYNDFWLEQRYGSLDEALLALEALRDQTVERMAKANTTRAGIRLIKPEGHRAE